MAEKEHGKIIHRQAGRILKPQGLVQKGKSRIWYDDQDWFTTLVEFQPHKREHGAFLNVGVNFHWYEQAYLSFDMGYRETQFQKFETAARFTAQIEAMVELALARVLAYREQLSDLTSAAEAITAHVFTSDSLWGNYHRGVICALNNDPDRAAAFFNDLLAVDHDVPWANELKDRTRFLMGLSGDNEGLKSHLSEIVRKTRELKKLEAVDFHF